MIEKHGWRLTVVPFFADSVLARFYREKRHSFATIVAALVARGTALRCARSADICWVEKELMYGMPDFFERGLGIDLRRCVIDYDDAVFLDCRKGLTGTLARGKFAHYARNAACITVGSDELEAHFRRLGGHHVVKVPSTVPVDAYPCHKPACGSIVIGWIGTPVTVRFLELVRNVLVELARLYHIQVHVVGAAWGCPGVDVQCFPWSEADEARLVSRFDIGIMPLVDGPWERAKCGYKLIQYMAAGVVGVGSRVGENEVVVDEGTTGFLAGESEEWMAKLSLLCENEELRLRMGRQARAKALREYDLAQSAAAMHRVFSNLVAPEAREI